MRKERMMRIDQFVCHLFVYLLLNLLLFSFLVMRLRMIRGKYLYRTPHLPWKLSLFIAHNYRYAFEYLYSYTRYIGKNRYDL
jgi:hypothetical protein